MNAPISGVPNGSSIMAINICGLILILYKPQYVHMYRHIKKKRLFRALSYFAASNAA